MQGCIYIYISPLPKQFEKPCLQSRHLVLHIPLLHTHLLITPTTLLDFALHFSKLLVVKLSHLLTQLEITNNGFYLRLVYYGGEPAIGVLVRFTESWVQHILENKEDTILKHD